MLLYFEDGYYVFVIIDASLEVLPEILEQTVTTIVNESDRIRTPKTLR